MYLFANISIGTLLKFACNSHCFVFLYCFHYALCVHRIRLIVNIVDIANIVFETCLHCRQLRPNITLP